MTLIITQANATTWKVGPTRSYPVPSAVAGLVSDGDTVEIDAGLYTGDVAKWFANDLLLRSVGVGYAHLAAGGNNAEGKAIWVIKGNNCSVEGIEFSGCQVPDQNGAGIRQEGINLTLQHCYFHNNEMGILTNNDGVSNYVFEYCEFSENGYGDGYSHNIYVGHVNSLTMRFCYSHDAKVGHLVKSRANNNYLFYNRLTGENGDGSYEIDLPNAGKALLIGNIIEQSPNSQNGGIISFGLEGATNPEKTLLLLNNTVVNDRFDGRFVQFSNEIDLVKMANNLFLGPGQLLQGNTASLDTTNNIHHLDIASGMLADPANYDYHLLENATSVDAGVDSIFFAGENWKAHFQYLHPMMSVARQTHGTATDIGAFEFEPEVSAIVPILYSPSFSIAPNPVIGNRLQLSFEELLREECQAYIMDLSGKIIVRSIIPKGTYSFEFNLEESPSGVNMIEIQGFGSYLFIKN